MADNILRKTLTCGILHCDIHPDNGPSASGRPWRPSSWRPRPALALWLWISPAGLEQAPEATFSIIDGRKIQLRALRDRPVLVTFWATTCPGCIKEMPHLVELYEEFGGQMELIGVAMSYDPPNRVLELARKRQLPYPVSLDLDGALAGAFGNVMLTPTSFLIAPGGKVVKHKIGEMDMGQLRRQLQTLLRDQERPS